MTPSGPSLATHRLARDWCLEGSVRGEGWEGETSKVKDRGGEELGGGVWTTGYKAGVGVSAQPIGRVCSGAKGAPDGESAPADTLGVSMPKSPET